MPMRVLALTACALLLASCATQPVVYTSGQPGFLMGLLHGLVSLFSLIGSLFWDFIRVHAYPNHGLWYDLGFVVGSAIFYGSAGALIGARVALYGVRTRNL
jgi:hypothetical protein